MTKATPLKRFWGTFLGWIIWSGRPTLNPSEVRRPTLNGPHLLVAGHIKALEEWSSCFLCAGPHFHWQAHLPWPLPSLLSEPTSPRFQSGLKSDRSLGPPLDSSTRLGLRDSQSHALTFPTRNSQGWSTEYTQMHTCSFYQLHSLETPTTTKASHKPEGMHESSRQQKVYCWLNRMLRTLSQASSYIHQYFSKWNVWLLKDN